MYIIIIINADCFWHSDILLNTSYYSQHLRHCRFPLYDPEHKAHDSQNSAFLLNTKHTTLSIVPFSWTQGTPLSAVYHSPEHKADPQSAVCLST